MIDNFAEPYNRPSWAGQDRGTYNTEDPTLFHPLTREEPLNGTGEHSTTVTSNNNNNNHHRRVSFTDWTMVGNLITGSNEAPIKA